MVAVERPDDSDRVLAARDDLLVCPDAERHPVLGVVPVDSDAPAADGAARGGVRRRVACQFPSASAAQVIHSWSSTLFSVVGCHETHTRGSRAYSSALRMSERIRARMRDTCICDVPIFSAIWLCVIESKKRICRTLRSRSHSAASSGLIASRSVT